MSVSDDWVNYPVGKIGKGEWCSKCGRFNSRKITCTVLGRHGDEILMVLRAKDPQKGWWALPGGYLEWDETVEKCVEREFEEETGYKIGNLHMLGVFSDIKRDLDGRQNVDCCFVGDVDVANQNSNDDEVIQVKWFKTSELPDKIAFDHGKMIEKYINQ